MLPYYHTPKGAALYQNMFANANRSFPQYVDELQGVADAVGVTLEEVSVTSCEIVFDNESVASVDFVELSF